MAHGIDMVMDFQYGSTGKGLIAGYLAKRNEYDTAVCAYGSNAGHTFLDASRDISMVTRQLPIAISSPHVKNVLLGPGAIIDPSVLIGEATRYKDMLKGKHLMIHPQAAIITSDHIQAEASMTEIGSTAKGVGAALIQRIQRDPRGMNTAKMMLEYTPLARYVVTEDQYLDAIESAERVIVEGAQGYSLSLYHGQYPYVTSRDVTPWQIAADCGLPFKWAPYIRVIGTLRTYPIRVNNRDGWSGPCYDDQREVTWDEVGVEPELTTVTKLPRRIFTFSQKQFEEAYWHCGGYWQTWLFLNFVNYINVDERKELIKEIKETKKYKLNPPSVAWLGYGPDDKDVEAT